MFYDEKETSFRITGVFRVKRDRGRLVPTSGRSFATLAYRIDGESRFFQGDARFTAKRKSTVFLPDHTSFFRKSVTREEIIAIHLKRLSGPEGTNEAQIVRVENETEELEQLFLRMLSEWEGALPGYYNRCMALLYTVFEKLEARNNPEKILVPAQITPGVAWIRKNFRDPSLTVAEAAKISFVSEVYFRRLYQKAFGISPLQDILRLRFDYAERLLRSGYHTTKEVSLLSGFSDVKYFRTAFTRRFGKTPSEFCREISEQI